MALSLSKLRHFQATFSSSSSTLPLEDPLPSPPSFVFLASPLITEKKKHKTVSTRACLRSLSLRTAIVADMAKITVASEGVCQASDGICDTVVGVLGGGQLGRMMCQAASYMGIKVAVLDPDRNCPAGDIAHHHMVGSFRDTEALREFVKGCGVVTVEIEHVDVESLEALEKKGVDIEPKPSTIRIIQDKYMQKVFFNQHGVALCDFMNIDSMESAKKAGQTFGYPLMIKSRWLAYDGRGNAVAQNEESLVEALSCLGGLERGLYAEKWTPFVKELAIMVTRARDGSLQCYPVVETTHKDNICHTVEAPAQVSKEIVDQALCVAKKAVGALQGAGVFGVELFLLENGQVLLNEVAPRPHNSGHYTIEACYTSQYEQHIRAVLGLPLGDCAMKVPAAIMYNLLGEDEGENGFAIAQSVMRRAISVPGASVHWYGKPEIRKQRKMGHITVVGESVRQVRSKINIIMSGEHNNGVMANVSHDSQVAVEDESIYSARNSASVGIIMGSDSDLPVMKAAAEILEEFGISYELTIVSAHRTPERMMSYARDAHKRGVEVIIAGAGGAAHLPGMVAAMTPLPVIGVPVRGSSLDGLDSLLSIVQDCSSSACERNWSTFSNIHTKKRNRLFVKQLERLVYYRENLRIIEKYKSPVGGLRQMPRGVPVATVAINNAMNAGLLAVRMLSLLDKTLQERLIVYQDSMKATVLTKAEKLEQVGWAAYLG